jgi:glycosyltransferase involved in cell wall biosynthesis
VRIAQVVPKGEQPSSGVLTVIVHLASALARRGHHVEVWQLHEWKPDIYSEPTRLLVESGAIEVPIPVSRRLGPTAAAVADERGIDLVHLHGAFNRSNTALSRSLRHPYVFSPHSGYHPVSLRRSRLRKAIYRVLFERRMLADASLLVALTDLELGHLRDFGARGPFAVIPNGVEPPRNHVDRLAFRRELGLSPETPFAVFVGRLDVHRKGLDVLVRGVSEAPGWHVALVGPRFRDMDRLERMISDLDVSGRVHVVGERHGHRLLESIGAADVFALLSRWEGLPMALLEAFAVGTPAVVSPAVDQVVGVEAAGAGWVAREADLGPLLRRLQRERREELEARRDAGLNLSKRYDWGAVAERYETAYERIMGGDG